jgi:hypothetical protein
MIARGMLLAGAAVLLTGCFDGHYDLALHNDGSGRIAVDIVIDKDMSRDILKAKHGKLDAEVADGGLGRNAHTTQRVENGSVVIHNELDFRSLAEITGSSVDVEVKPLGRTVLGAQRSLIRFSNSANGAAARKYNRDDDVGNQFVRQMFKGHEMTVTMHLPCAVETASSFTIDGERYAPKIDAGWFSGSTVAWRLPMAAAIALEDHGGQHDFSATCWSYAGIKPGHSRNR